MDKYHSISKIKGCHQTEQVSHAHTTSWRNESRNTPPSRFLPTYKFNRVHSDVPSSQARNSGSRGERNALLRSMQKASSCRRYYITFHSTVMSPPPQFLLEPRGTMWAQRSRWKREVANQGHPHSSRPGAGGRRNGFHGIVRHHPHVGESAFPYSNSWRRRKNNLNEWGRDTRHTRRRAGKEII